MKLTEKLAELQAVDFDTRCQALEEAWGKDAEKMSMLSQAVDLVKAAEAEGAFGRELTDSQLITLAAEVVQEVLAKEAEETTEEAEETTEASEEEQTEEAEDADASSEEEISEEEQEKLASFYNLVSLAAEALKNAGVDFQDLEKIASKEDAEQVARFLVQYLVELENEAAAK